MKKPAILKDRVEIYPIFFGVFGKSARFIPYDFDKSGRFSDSRNALFCLK